MTGDPTYGTPSDGTAPTDDNNPYKYKDSVTVKEDLTTSWTTSDGTADGIPGEWKFTPWDKSDFEITEDTEIHGAWTFVPDKSGGSTPGPNPDPDDPDNPDKPTPGTDPDNPGSPDGAEIPDSSVKTGDDTYMNLWITLLAMSGLGAAGMTVSRRRKKE